MTDESTTQKYYDDFSDRYEARRGGAVRHGYHELLDHLESDFVRHFGSGKRVLEVGCGTGLVLERIREFTSSAQGIDLSPGMLEKARARGLDVTQGSATELPFDDDTFDVTCSFKVLAHIPAIETALSEMARVTKPGGYILAEFYNPWSFRGLLRWFGPSRPIGTHHKESDVFTRFDAPPRIAALTPPNCEFETARGVRVLTVAAPLIDNRILGPTLFRLEQLVADTPLKLFGGFYIAAYKKLKAA